MPVLDNLKHISLVQHITNADVIIPYHYAP
jgi:hypothetical protein